MNGEQLKSTLKFAVKKDGVNFVLLLLAEIREEQGFKKEGKKLRKRARKSAGAAVEANERHKLR